MIISRTWAMPNKKTFTIKPIRELIDKWVVESEALDPFPFEYSEDALDYLKRQTPKRYALFDPPYSPRQLKECYKGKGNFDTKASTWSTWKNELSKKILPGGICISFGWSSQGMGKNRGFVIKEILLVAHGGMHNDTICVVEQKVQSELPHKPKVETQTRLEETSEGRTSIPPTNDILPK